MSKPNRPLLSIFDPARRPFVGALTLGLLHAACFALAYPPFEGWWLVFVAPLPLLVVALRTPRGLRSALAVAIASAPAWWAHHRWIGDISMAGLPGLIVYLSLWPGGFVWLGAAVRRRVPTLPAVVWAPTVWCGLELLRARILFDGYPWFLIAHPTIAWRDFAALGALVGVQALALLVVLPSAALATLLSGRRVAGGVGLALAGGALGGAALLGYRPGLDTDPALRLAVAQTNVPQSVRGVWEPRRRIDDALRLMDMTRFAAEQTPAVDLIVWPETMFGGATLSPDAVEVEREAGSSWVLPEGQRLGATAFYDDLLRLQASTGVPMIVGAEAVEGLVITKTDEGLLYEPERVFNSAFVLRNGAVQAQRYDKIHLTPFGEVMPGISSIEWLERALLALGAQGMTFDLDAGETPVRLEPVDGGPRIATPICFEVTSAHVVRALATEGGERAAGLIVNLTNDGWFVDHAGGREHHAMLARWRCLELATPMVRAANTGVSVAYDAHGEPLLAEWYSGGRRAIVQQAPIRDGGVLIVDVEPSAGAPTLYARFGDVLAWLALAGTIALGASIGMGALMERRRRRDAQERRGTGPTSAASGGVEANEPNSSSDAPTSTRTEA